MILKKKIAFAHIYLLIAAIIVNAAVAGAQGNHSDSMSLLEAVKLALRADNMVAAAGQNLMAADVGIKAAKGAYWPTLASSGSYSHVTKTNEISFDIPGIGQRNIKIAPDNPFNTNLSLSWDVYTFGRRSGTVGIARQEMESSQYDLVRSKKHLFDSVARSYLTAVYARMNLELVQDEQERFSSIYNLVEQRFNQQLTPEFDLLQMQLRLKQYELSVLEQTNNFETARLNLAEMLGMDIETLPQLSDQLDTVGLQLPSYHDNSATLERREDYRQALARKESARLSRQVRKSTYFPNISLFGAYDLRNGYQPDLEKAESNFTVGVNFKWLLFNGFTRRAELVRQDHLWKASGYIADDLKSIIPVQAKSAGLAMDNSRSRIEVGERSLEVAQKALTIAQKRYEIGDISMIDLLETENKLAEAEAGLLKLRYHFLMTQLDLKAALSYYPELERIN